MKRISLIVSILFLSSLSFSAQTKAEAKAKAKTQINQLKEGTMLVRLSDKSPVIKALEEKGMHKRARLIKMKQIKVNKEIIASFRNFTFCRVFFFYSSDSELLKKRNFTKLKLYHDIDSLASGVRLDTNFFVADFGMLSNEASSKTKTSQPKQSGISKKKIYKGSNVSTSMRCMYLRDSRLNQLEGPFPFYVRFHPTPIQNLSYKQVVERMNRQLVKFHQSPKK
mgnify:CR=1 FL=1